MIKRRSRVKQTTSFKERLATFARELREEARTLPPGPQRDDLLKRASRADTAAHLAEWAGSPDYSRPPSRLGGEDGADNIELPTASSAYDRGRRFADRHLGSE